MGSYSDMKYGELQAESKARGLPAGGSSEDLVARLDAYDAARSALPAGDEPDLLGALDSATAEAQPSTAEAATGTPDFDIVAPPSAPESAAAEPASTIYKVAFPCPHPLTTGLHEDNRLRAYHQAVAKGLAPRSGLAGVRRSGWTTIEGVRHALYEVQLRR